MLMAVLCFTAATAPAAPAAADPPARPLYRAPSRDNLSGGGSSSGMTRVPSNSNLEVVDVRGVASHPWWAGVW
jgi:hypothetical protein